MHAREVILRASARSRRGGDGQFLVALFVSQVFQYRSVQYRSVQYRSVQYRSVQYRSVKTVSSVAAGGPERMFSGMFAGVFAAVLGH
jgi:hypothetical protein